MAEFLEKEKQALAEAKTDPAESPTPQNTEPGSQASDAGAHMQTASQKLDESAAAAQESERSQRQRRMARKQLSRLPGSTDKSRRQGGGRIVLNGIAAENPALRLVLGTCPTLAVTSSAMNGLGMGISTMVVLLCSNVLISLLRRVIPARVRIPAYVVIIAGFVSMVQMLLAAYLPDLNKALGIYIPLIVVNCIILGRAEAFASKNGIFLSFCDGLGMGLGFTLALLGLGAFREVIGAGSIFGISLFGPNAQPMLLMVLPPGGFLGYGLVMGLMNYLDKKRRPHQDPIRENRAGHVVQNAKTRSSQAHAGGAEV